MKSRPNHVGTRITDETKQDLLKVAELKEWSMAYVIAKAIEHYVEFMLDEKNNTK